MEQAVWFYVGILAALIGMGMLVSIILMGMDVTKQQLARNSAGTLQLQCDNVCDSDIGTMFGIDMKIGSGTVIESRGQSICVHYKEIKECRKCGCEVVGADMNQFKLDLSTPEARELFETAVYNCTFEKVKDGEDIYVILRCKR